MSDVTVDVSLVDRGRPDVRAGLSAGAPYDGPLALELGRLHRALRSSWEAAIADLELSAAQAASLRALSESPGCGLRELARRMQTDAMNAKRIVDYLEAMQLVASRHDPLHRQRRACWPTEKGHRLARELARRAEVWNRELSERLGDGELRQFLTVARRLESALASGDPTHPG
jgi:DNA-binding MarR family transcriptional regulator